MPSRVCTECKVEKPKADFSLSQWKKKGKCRECTEAPPAAKKQQTSRKPAEEKKQAAVVKAGAAEEEKIKNAAIEKAKKEEIAASAAAAKAAEKAQEEKVRKEQLTKQKEDEKRQQEEKTEKEEVEKRRTEAEVKAEAEPKEKEETEPLQGESPTSYPTPTQIPRKLTKIAIDGFSEDKGFTEYHILVAYKLTDKDGEEEQEWRVLQRYSNFLKLHTHGLGMKEDSFPEPKHWFHPLSVKTKRQSGLEAYLQKIVELKWNAWEEGGNEAPDCLKSFLFPSSS